jgi:hypothetical protein
MFHCGSRFPCATDSDPVSQSTTQQPVKAREMCGRAFVNMIVSIVPCQPALLGGSAE